VTDGKKPTNKAKPKADHKHDDLEKRVAELEVYCKAIELLARAIGQYPPSMFVEQAREQADV
jgi:hypothetical protein